MINLQNLTTAETNARNQFFRADGAIQRLRSFVIMNSDVPRSGNCILFGAGGYGKSELGYSFIKDATGQEPFVANLNQATTAAEIFGGTDLEKFAKGDGIHYLFENSFMAHEWVILEEGLEPRPRVLSALKHILTSGIFAPAGVLPMPIKTKGILIVTNIDTESFMDSLDTAAFLERFPLQYRVDWNHLNSHERFQASLQVVEKFDPGHMIGGQMRNTIAEYFSGKKQSPRMISRAVQALIATAKVHGNKMVNNEVFVEVSNLLGFGTQDMSKKIEEDRVTHEIDQARKAYTEMFNNIEDSIRHYNSLRDSLDDSRYIVALGQQLLDTIRLLQSLSDSVVEMRVNARFGNRGDELASWVNARIGELSDNLEGIKGASWQGMLIALNKLIKKIEVLEETINANEAQESN